MFKSFREGDQSIFNFLVSLKDIRRWSGPLEKVAGTLLIVLGVLMVTGHFATLSAFLADMGQLINLEL